LAEKLGGNSRLQSRQHLAVLSRWNLAGPEDTGRYIEHWLKVAGYEGRPLFASDARSIIAAQVGRKKVDESIVLEAAGNLDVESFAGLRFVLPGTYSVGVADHRLKTRTTSQI
jgi:hypothetical protein